MSAGVVVSHAPSAYAAACSSVSTAYAGGDGSSADPYQISTAGELILLSTKSNDGTTVHSYSGTHFEQTADINLDDCGFTPIGPGSNPFEGVYDGGNFNIVDLDVVNVSGRAGLFAVLKGTITRVAIEGGSVTGGVVGALVGQNSGTISNSSSSASVTGNGVDGDEAGQAGGFVGWNEQGGVIQDSEASGATTSDNSRAGGFAGRNDGNITGSSASGVVTITEGDNAGGFVGHNGVADSDGKDGTIDDSSATGDVFAGDSHGCEWPLCSERVGGFVGENDGLVKNSSATGNASTGGLGGDIAGGFAGLNDSDGVIENSTASGDASADDNAGGFVGENEGTITDSSATGKATATEYRAGGFAGLMDGDGDGFNSRVERSYATGDASAKNEAGGFIGSGESEEDGEGTITITDSSATGKATATGRRAGGFAGQIEESDSRVERSYATGDASANNQVGGFVGRNEGQVEASYATGDAEATVDEAGGFAARSGGSGTISRAYSIGTATAPDDVGGFLGYGVSGATTEDSFWDTTTSGLTASAGATGKTTAQITALATFDDTGTVGLDSAWAIAVGWEAYDFDNPTNVWGICSGVNDGYPFLLWQYTEDPCASTDSGGGNAGRNDDDDDGDTVAAVVTPAPSAAATARSRVADATTRQPVAGPVLRGGVVSAPPRIPTVLVGGVPTIVEESSPDPTTLSVLAGSLSVDVSVDEDSGEVSRLDDGSNRLSVKSGSAAALRGSGLQPGARVQVFIPLGVDDSRELANVTVAADGTFSGEMPVSTDPLAEPLPIGERLLQLVSVDADGNQVVFEMAVNVTQADPAPALDREAGEIPVVGLGASAVTSAGVVTAATMTALADQGLAIVEGDTWNMTIAIDSEQGGVESTESGALVTLVRNEAAQVSGVGFMAGTRADVWLFSEPVLLGTVTVDENGDFSGEVGIDSELIPTGEHTLQLQGVGQDGYVKAATMGVSVNDAQPELAAAEQAGLDLGFIWWILAIIVLVAIVVALWLRRNRRA